MDRLSASFMNQVSWCLGPYYRHLGWPSAGRTYPLSCPVVMSQNNRTTGISARLPGSCGASARPGKALERALEGGTGYVILDGMMVAPDRCRGRPSAARAGKSTRGNSGKERDFGGNIQGVFYLSGISMRVSDVLPSIVHGCPGGAAAIPGRDPGAGPLLLTRCTG